MRLRNIVEVLVFTPIKENVKGEYQTKWKYKGMAHLNKQQDINELDRNSAGEIDYEIIKLHTDSIENIEKGDGISFTTTDGLVVDKEKVLYHSESILLVGMSTSAPPEYLVDSCPKIGKSTVYTCKTNTEA